ncbi:MAG: OsmC family protein [Chloroflexi bacterium]|nr:OsmC family protein [Chloroflexota bacterium]
MMRARFAVPLQEQTKTMAQAHVTWVQGKTFVGTDSTKHSVVISSVDDGVGIKPSELLLLALGSCTAYDVVNILEKRRAQITDVRVTVTGEQETEPPWPFRKIHLHYAVSGSNLKRDDVEKAIRLSEEKYCSVSATLRQSVEITYDFDVLADTETTVEAPRVSATL